MTNPRTDSPQSTTDTLRAPRPSPASPGEVRYRVARVQEWILDEGIQVEEAVARLGEEYGIGRRQSLRYWVRAYVPFLSEEDRDARARGLRPQCRTGFTVWPSISRLACDGGPR